jgi:pectin methylesterase-like acyl-CoA thioesterase
MTFTRHTLRGRLLVLTLLALLVCVSAAFGQPNSSFYVATTGNDSNPGTQAAPWRTIQHAADTARAGSTVNVRGGIYEELVSINASGNAIDGFITLEAIPAKRRSWTRSISLLRKTGRTHDSQSELRANRGL